MNSSNLIPQDMSSKTSEDVVIGGKRPLNRTGKNGEILSEKKLRRLEKNRLSARECRRRKREATENLQRQINMLEGENLRLRLQLQVRFSKRRLLLYPPQLPLTQTFHCIDRRRGRSEQSGGTTKANRKSRFTLEEWGV